MKISSFPVVAEFLTFAVALGSAVLIFQLLTAPAHAPGPGKGSISNEVAVPAGVYFPKPADKPEESLATLAQFLQSGDEVIFGSSELTSPADTAVQRFFPKACGRRVASFGSAGFQSLPILLTLNDVRASLGPQSRVTIILSPVWFTEPGTPSATFLGNMRPHQMFALAQDKNLPPQVRASVLREVRDKLDDFSGLYPDWMVLSFPALGRLFWPEDQDPTHGVKVKIDSAPVVSQFDWAGALAYWRNEDKKLSGDNPLGTTLQYYDRIKDDKPPFPSHKLDSWKREEKDLFALSDFLKSYGVHAHFILEPVHRRVYKNLAPYDELFAEIERQLKNDGHSWKSYFVEPFDLSVLSDSQHFSNSAWVAIQHDECLR